jgi:hypothetical protein
MANAAIYVPRPLTIPLQGWIGVVEIHATKNERKREKSGEITWELLNSKSKA